jgi:hypothetical protein
MSGAGNMGGAGGAAKGFGGRMKGLLDGAGQPGRQFDRSGFRDAMGDFRGQMQDMRGDFRDQMGDLRGKMQQAWVPFEDAMGNFSSRSHTGTFSQGQPGQSSVSVNVNGQNMPDLDFGQIGTRLQQGLAPLQDLGPDIQQRLQRGLAPLRRAGFPFSR